MGDFSTVENNLGLEGSLSLRTCVRTSYFAAVLRV